MNGIFIALNISSDGARLAEIGYQNGIKLVKGLWHLRADQELHRPMTDRIRELVTEKIPGTRKALLILSSEDLSYRDFNFPFSSSKKVMHAIRFEISTEFPPMEYMIAPIETISGEPGRKAILVAVVRKEVLKKRITEAEESGLKLIGITSDISTIGDYFIDENEALVMEAGQRQTLFALYSHRVPVLVREIPIGLMDILNPGREFKQENLKPLASEIKRTVLSFGARSKFNLEKIHLSGSLIENKEVVRSLNETHDFHFIDQPPVTGAVKVQAQDVHLNAYASLLGSAVWKKKTRSFDFYKEEFAGQDAAASGKTYLRWGALVIACFLCSILFSWWLEIFALQTRSRFLSTEARRVFSTTFPSVTRVVDEVRQARNMLDIRKSESGGVNPISTISLLDLMDLMSRNIPKEVHFQVVNLFWERGRLEIDGRTDSFKTVNVIQQLLSKSQDFPEVSISNAKTRSDGQDVDFKITIRLAG